MLTLHSHLFYRCGYIADIWAKLRLVLPEISSSRDTTLDQTMNRAKKRTRDSKCWASTWSIIETTTWAIWKERNKRKYEEKYTMVSEIARRIISDTILGARVLKFKKASTRREEELITLWYQ